jgi:tetratricopeptide (TPR) repeat protein
MGPAQSSALAAFAADLQRLRVRAARPSLHRLVALSATLPRPLARSTISDKLNAKSLPDWDFVWAFVTACAAHAASVGAPIDAASVDLSAWDAKHLGMLRVLETGQDADRLRSAASLELARRAGGHGFAADPAATPGARTDRPARDVPRQLPPALSAFVGRGEDLAALRRAVVDPLTGPAIVGIHGPAGIGKTAMAVLAAHQLAPGHPDGQLYLDLRGFHPAGSPLGAADALRVLLDALQISPERVPPTVEAMAAVYRGELAGRRILLVLDNALDADHVRPLLPAGPGCTVLVTSRNRLAGLAASHGARPIALGLLRPEESRQLLAERVGAGRVADEPEAAAEIAAACAGLPLALCVVAARAATHPTFRLEQLARELHRSHGALAALDPGEVDVDVRGALSWSYGRLTTAAAGMFRLLGLHPAAEITLAGAASLAGLPPERARSGLAELSRVHLVEEDVPGRFRLHDLLRAYAAELSGALDDATVRREALGRVLEYALQTSYETAQLLGSLPAGSTAPRPIDVVTPEPLDGRESALAWFLAERSTLIDLVGYAATSGFDVPAFRLTRVLAKVVNRQGMWPQWVAAQEAALAACLRSGSVAEQADSYSVVGLTKVHLGQYDEAMALLDRAVGQFRAVGDLTGEASTLLNLGGMAQLRGDYAAALEHAACARDLFARAADLAGLAKATNCLGWCHAQLGDYAASVVYCRDALALLQQLGSRLNEAYTWDSLGYAHQRQGEYAEAASCYERARELNRQFGDRYLEAQVLDHLGDIDLAAGDVAGADAHWREAWTILDELGHPDAADLFAKLARSN